MMTATTCPTAELLRLFSLGQLPDDQADELTEHLRDCSRCQAELETVDDAEDSLITGLRASTGTAEYLDEPDCRHAVAKALGALAVAAEGPESADEHFPRTIGEYEIVRHLGSGGMGNVYLARHTKLGREVAVKVLASHRLNNLRVRERFEAEMRAVGRLSHPNIVTAYDARDIDGTPVLVTEYIDGFDLGQLVQRTGALSIADACEIVRQVAVALQYTNEQGFVHRDVKPSNIMLSTTGEVKLLDLGLARLQFDDDAVREITTTGQAIGTADYIAPEQVNDSRAVDVRADIYSLGCTLYKLLAGRAPFADEQYRNTFAKMTAHVSAEPPALRTLRTDVPQSLAKLITTMLAKRPEDRVQSPQRLVEQLAAFTAGSDLKKLSEQADLLEPKEDSPLSVAVAHSIAHARPQRFFDRRVPMTLALGSALFGLLIGVLLGVLLTIKLPDGSLVQMNLPDGSQVSLDSTSEDQPRGKTIPARAAQTAPPDASWDPYAAAAQAGMVPPHTSSPGKFQPLSFAVIPSDEPPAAAVEQLRATLENNPQDRVIVTPYGTWYLVRGDMSVPGSTTHNGRKFVLVTNRQDGRVYWEQIRGQIGMQGGMLLFHEDLGERMRVLTRNHIGQHLAFLLDGRVVFAPRISSAINQHAKLTGNLTPDEIRYLVECINGLVTKPLSYAEEGNMGAPPTDARPSSDGTPLPAASTQPYARPLAFAILDPSKPRDDDRKELIQTLEKAPESVRVATGNGTWHRLDDGVTLNDDSLVTIDGKHFVRISNLNDNLIPWQDVQGHIIAVKTSHEDKQSNIELTFDERLATRMLQLTGANLNKQLAILFNDRVVAAPKIFAKVNDKALITGRFDAEEVEKLRLSLMAGQTSNNPQLDMPLSEMSPDDQTTNKSHSISTSDKLRMIGVAMHQYVDAYGRFPASQSYLSTLTSQPFSWRVALLPYLGYQELYDKFHVNEPWDSEHNKALLAEMPDIYRSSHAPDLQPAGWTNMFGFSGDNTVLGKEKGAAMHDITDGTSNTLLVVESASCVEWTKPEDFAFMNAKDVHVVNLVPNQPLSFLMADGGVRHMDLVDWKELAKMVTRAGGE